LISALPKPLAGFNGTVLSFQDHFSARAAEYSQARPHYPAALFEHLARLSRGHRLAWDCGTGNGQAATGIAEHFEQVIATDPSEAQLANAFSHPRVTYRLGQEQSSGLADGSADLVTAAQAAHWFDLGAFYREARRVLHPKGVIALWCYGLCRIAPQIDGLLSVFYVETVGPYWPPERHHIDAAYRTLSFPFDELSFPPVTMEHRWNLHELTSYLDTWSAVSGFRKKVGSDPLPPFIAAIAPAWGDPDEPRRIEWPLAVRAGYV
jgi:SAM-dependent methyltransferase